MLTVVSIINYKLDLLYNILTLYKTSLLQAIMHFFH